MAVAGVGGVALILAVVLRFGAAAQTGSWCHPLFMALAGAA